MWTWFKRLFGFSPVTREEAVSRAVAYFRARGARFPEDDGPPGEALVLEVCYLKQEDNEWVVSFTSPWMAQGSPPCCGVYINARSGRTRGMELM